MLVSLAKEVISFVTSPTQERCNLPIASAMLCDSYSSTNAVCGICVLAAKLDSSKDVRWDIVEIKDGNLGVLI